MLGWAWNTLSMHGKTAWKPGKVPSFIHIHTLQSNHSCNQATELLRSMLLYFNYTIWYTLVQTKAVHTVHVIKRPAHPQCIPPASAPMRHIHHTAYTHNNHTTTQQHHPALPKAPTGNPRAPAQYVPIVPWANINEYRPDQFNRWATTLCDSDVQTAATRSGTGGQSRRPAEKPLPKTIKLKIKKKHICHFRCQAFLEQANSRHSKMVMNWIN